jgi:hypothetical protein
MPRDLALQRVLRRVARGEDGAGVEKIEHAEAVDGGARKGLHPKERANLRRLYRPEMKPGGKLFDLVQSKDLRLEYKRPPRPDPVAEALSEYHNDAVPITEPEPEPPEGMEAVRALGNRELTRAVEDALEAGLGEDEVFYIALSMKPKVAVYQLSRAANRYQSIRDKEHTASLAEQLSDAYQRIEREVEARLLAELKLELLESPDKLRERIGVRQRPRAARQDDAA